MHKKLSAFNIKLPREIGKVTYISDVPTKKEFNNLVLYRIVLFIVMIISAYLAYKYLYIDNYHKPMYKYMNSGRKINIEPFFFISYIMIFFLTLKEIIFLSKNIKVVADKGVVIYTFRFSKKYTSEHIKLYKDKDFKIGKYIKTQQLDKFEKELVEQYIFGK